MNTFIVRIYRFGDKDLQQLFGLVEIPGSDQEERFASMEELWAIVSCGWHNGKKKRGETNGLHPPRKN